MSAVAGDRDTAEAVALALAFYRAPAKHAELLHEKMPLPNAAGVLLRLAAGGRLEKPEYQADPETLRKAARFFIEQVMFRHDANHFRVLGVNPGAGLEQIKEHHRLLMRLFHPDREQPGAAEAHGGWNAAYATRVNLAYNTLRDADARSRYLSSLNLSATRNISAGASAVPSPPPVRTRHRPISPDSFWTVRAEPYIKRHLPQFILGATALVGVLVLGVVYLSNPPVTVDVQTAQYAWQTMPAANDLASPAQNKVVEEARFRAVQMDMAIARFERGEQAPAPAREAVVAQPLPQHPVRQVPIKQVVTQVAVTQPAVTPKPDAAPVRVNPPETKSIPAPVVWVPVQSAAAKTVSATPAPAPASVAHTVAVQAPPSNPAVNVPPSQTVRQVEQETVVWNPLAILSRMSEAYEQGDTREWMSLFDESASTQAGNWTETRRDYEILFRNTELRDLHIENMNWNGDGETLRGQGRYRLTHMRKGETSLRSQSGILRMELSRRGRNVLITELHYLGGRP